jgi:hypothetical protein
MARPATSKQKRKKSLESVTKGEMEQLLADQASMINAGVKNSQPRRDALTFKAMA